MRSFSLVLLRRFLFRTTPHHQNSRGPGLTLYDRLPSQTLTTLERLLLHSLSHEPVRAVRYNAIDTVCDLANNSMSRGRPWHALQAQVFTITQGPDPGLREAAYRIFAGCPNLVMDLQTDAVLGVFQRGLQDSQSIDVSVIFYPPTPPLIPILLRSVMQRLKRLYPISPHVTLHNFPNLSLFSTRCFRLSQACNLRHPTSQNSFLL
jgi:importin-5